MRDLEAFVAITQWGSVTAAAENLHLSQPAVSQRLQRIEEELGCALFERIGTKLLLTPAGKVLLNRCISLIADMKETIREVKLASSAPSSFSIGMVDILSETHFAHKFKDFCVSHPTVDIQLRTASNDEIADAVASGQLDVGFRYLQDKRLKNIEQIKVSDEILVVIAAHQTKLIPSPCNIENLSGVRWITYPSEGSSGSIFSSMLHSHLLMKNVGESSPIEVDSLTAQKRLVEADFGLGFVPMSSVQDELRNKTLQMVDIPSLKVHVPVIAMYRLSSAVIGFIENFVDLISTESPDTEK